LLPSETSHNTGVVAKVQIALGRGFKRGNFFDPEAAYRKLAKAKTGQDPWVFVRFSEGRALWRDSTTLLRLTGQDTRPPVALPWIAELSENKIVETGAQYQLIAYGFCANAGRDDILFWRHERMPLPVQYLSDESVLEKLAIALKSAEDSVSVLRRAGDRLARRLLYPGRDEAGIAKAQAEEANRLTRHLALTERYWSMLEIPFGDVMRTLPHDPDAALTAWQTTIHEVAVGTFEAATRNLDQSARALRAVTEGHALLVSGLSRILQPQN
jgi:CRISPR type I-E-associated protein CasA/Cse1